LKILIGVLYTLLPEILLFSFATLLGWQAQRFPHAGQLAAEITTAAILVAALALSLQFNKSRLFFALLVLLLAYGGLLLLMQTSDTVSQDALRGCLCLFLPLNLLLFSRIEERGIFTRYGAVWFGLVGAESLLPAGLILAGGARVAAALDVHFISTSVTSLPITQPGLLAIGLGLLWLNDRLLRRHSAELAAFFLSLVVTLPMLYTGGPAVVAVFAGAAGLAFGYALIQESWSMAYLDELTGLPGRRALEEHMRQLAGHYVIAMVDVDHFKHFNDRYGHDVGDQVLRFVASRLELKAAGSKPFRYGGEEFCLIFAGRTFAEVEMELEQLRADIETCRFDLRRRGRRNEDHAGQEPGAEADMLAITVSIGAAEGGAGEREPWTVLKSADKALYAAKHAGRNRLSLA
jgi:diguanylate cyclase (GGDEF)-like protein